MVQLHYLKTSSNSWTKMMQTKIYFGKILETVNRPCKMKDSMQIRYHYQCFIDHDLNQVYYIRASSSTVDIVDLPMNTVCICEDIEGHKRKKYYLIATPKGMITVNVNLLEFLDEDHE